MRVIAGTLGGRRLVVPARGARPTTDRVRESLFSIIAPDLPDATVLDLCAGSGALGIEALSRGARFATFVDLAEGAVRVIRRNIDELGLREQCRVEKTDALRFVANLTPLQYDVAFADPPFDSGLAARLADCWLRLPFARLFCVEHSARDTVGPGETRRYGDTAITFFRH